MSNMLQRSVPALAQPPSPAAAGAAGAPSPAQPPTQLNQPFAATPPRPIVAKEPDKAKVLKDAAGRRAGAIRPAGTIAGGTAGSKLGA